MTELKLNDPFMCIVQGAYNFEANQVVQCMYPLQNPVVMDHQDNPNMYRQSNFYAD